MASGDHLRVGYANNMQPPPDSNADQDAAGPTHDDVTPPVATKKWSVVDSSNTIDGDEVVRCTVCNYPLLRNIVLRCCPNCKTYFPKSCRYFSTKRDRCKYGKRCNYVHCTDVDDWLPQPEVKELWRSSTYVEEVNDVNEKVTCLQDSVDAKRRRVTYAVNWENDTWFESNSLSVYRTPTLSIPLKNMPVQSSNNSDVKWIGGQECDMSQPLYRYLGNDVDYLQRVRMALNKPPDAEEASDVDMSDSDLSMLSEKDMLADKSETEKATFFYDEKFKLKLQQAKEADNNASARAVAWRNTHPRPWTTKKHSKIVKWVNARKAKAASSSGVVNEAA